MNIGISVSLPTYKVDVAFMARKAEELGFESFWCAEHPIMPVHSSSRFPGSRFTAQPAYPKGHRHNPFSDTDIEAKSRRLAGEVLTEQQCRTVLELLWSLERLPDLPALFDALDAGDPPPNWVLRTAIGPASMAG